jgi:hypothetical protein
LLPDARRRIEVGVKRPLLAVVSLLVGVAGVAACPSPKEPLPSVGTTPIPSSSASSSSGDNVFRCKDDAECRSASYYCGGCTCLALAEQESAPQCIAGDEVKCLIDPCRGKASFCDQGHCNLRDAAP